MRRQWNVFDDITETRFAADGGPLPLAVLLVVGLVFGAPLFATVVDSLSVPLPVPILVGVVLVGGAYAVLVLVLRRVTLGLSVALIVTATFAANVPLTATAGAYPGDLGPQLWLVQLPLLALVGAFVVSGAYTRASVTAVELALGGYVLWSVVSALFGIAPQRDTALYYALHVLNWLLAFSVSYRSVRERVITFEQTLWVFVVAVAGHAAFGLVQFVNRASFGWSYLGETGRDWSTTVIGLGPLGEFNIGILISGFTGGSGPLSVLLVMAIPLVLVSVVRARSVRRLGSAAVFLSLLFVLRTTAKDAARGAVVLALVVFVVLFVWSRRHERPDWDAVQSRAAEYGLYCLSAVALFAVTFYPSSRESSDGSSGGAGALASGGAQGSTGTGSGGGGTGARELPVELTQLVSPFFDLTALGGRLQQSVGGLAMAINHPLFGVGGANYFVVAPAYGLDAKLNGNPFPLHNVYAAVLAETGVPGFSLYALTLGLVVWNGWHLYREGSDWTVATGALAAVVGYLAVSFWVVNTRLVMTVPFWILAGALVAERHRT